METIRGRVSGRGDCQLTESSPMSDSVNNERPLQSTVKIGTVDLDGWVGTANMGVVTSYCRPSKLLQLSLRWTVR